MSTHIIHFKDTTIILGRDLIDSNIITDMCQTSSVVVLSDDHISSIYGEQLTQFLRNSDVEVHLLTFKAGEASKSRKTKEKIEDQMQELGLGRDTTLIGLGGGVTTDLAGFIAATYCRGIPFISIPTSLLAMIDASIGGKTGVNTPYGKNLIGCFYQPDSILIDYSFLKTLSLKQAKEGLVEMIKTGLVYDQSLFEKLCSYSYAEGIIDEDLQEMIKECCKIKLKIVEQDFEEKNGLRRILNFGHTVGHALEKVFEYQIGHGEAVAMGMICESYMAMKMELLNPKAFHQVLDLLRGYYEPRDYSSPKVYEMMLLDKKSKDKTPRFVMLEKIGRVCSCKGEYCMSVEQTLVIEALEFLLHLEP